MNVKMTAAEHAELTGFAAGVGRSLPRFLVEYSRLAVIDPAGLPGASESHDGRRCAVERQQISALYTRVSAATRMLGGAATNLNQTVREMHVHKLAGEIDQMMDTIMVIEDLAVEVAEAARRIGAESRSAADRLTGENPIPDTSEWAGT